MKQLHASFQRPKPDFAGLTLDRPRIMGILNVTPDSFSDGGLHINPIAGVDAAFAMLENGADVLDIGGESTRPGAEPVSPEIEQSRVVPVIEAIRASGCTAPISIDTRNAATAGAALDAGATIVNDVSALTHDPHMARVVAEAKASLCLMHMQGTPQTMQDNPSYDNVTQEVIKTLSTQLEVAVSAGIARDQIMVDPGIGFGKTEAHNLTLLRELSKMHDLDAPILLGVSRKGFIGRIGRETDASKRAPGSIAVGLNALEQGVQMLRVHDVPETAQAIRLWLALNGGEDLI